MIFEKIKYMHKKILIFAGIMGFLSVALGAMGAHALKNILSSTELASYETAVRYQFLHVFAILLTAIPNLNSKNAAIFWSFGIILFSGSIYLWLVTGIKGFVHVTPIGGISFMIGWILFSLHIFKNFQSNS